MKYQAKIYAKALADLLSSNKEDEIVDNFLKLLEKNRDMSKAGKIIELARNIYAKKSGKKIITIETARKIGKIIKGDIVEEKITPELIAGVRITINNEKQLDNSISAKLKKIF